MASKYEMVTRPVYENGIWKGAKVDLQEGFYKLGQRIFDQFKENPDFVGQINGLTGEEDTYKSMGDRSIRCALWLTKQGARRGDIVGVCSKNQLDSCIPLFASLYLGCICSPLSHRYIDEELARHYIDTRKPKVLFIDEDNADLVVEIVKNIGYSMPIIVFGQRNGLLSFKEILKVHTDEEMNKFRCRDVKPEDPAIIINTSGTTNLPKAVVHSFGSYANMLKYFENDGKPSIVMGSCGINGIAGYRLVIRSVLFKNSMIVIDDDLSWTKVLELIEKYKVIQLWMTIYLAQRLMITPDLSRYDLSSVQIVTWGGGRSETDTMEFLQKLFSNAELHPRYGATEFGTATTKSLDVIKLTSAGRVMANVEIKIVDTKTNEILGPNEEGELYIRTPKMMTCYWGNEKATIEAIDPEGQITYFCNTLTHLDEYIEAASPTLIGWFHSGDLGYYDVDGDFFLIARYNEFIFNCKGRTLSSVIVNVIKQVTGVNEVVVLPQAHPDYYEVPIAFITTIPGADITKDDVSKVVEKKLPDYMKLRGGIHFLQSMPTTDTGKINTRILREIVKASVRK